VRALDVFLFDLDGTLIDSLELIRRSLVHTLASHGLPALTREEWLDGLGTPLTAQFRRYTADPKKIEELVRTYRTWNLAHHDALVRPFDGVRESLESLADSGGRLGVVTSKQRASARRSLECCGLGDLFEVLVGADDVDHGKPAPDPVLLALERLGARAERAVYVGDSPHDISAARAAGTRTAAVLWGSLSRAELEPHKPDVWIDHPTWLGELGRHALKR